MKMKKLLTAPNLSLELRTGMVQCYILPVFLYGLEDWTLYKESTNQLEVFQI